MYSLASYLDKFSWEKEVKKKNSGTPSSCCQTSDTDHEPILPIGRYLVPVVALEGETTSRECLDTITGEQLTCRVYSRQLFQEKSSLFFAGTRRVHKIRDVLFVGDRAFVFSGVTHGDLHQYLRDKKRLSEVQAAPLFRQIVELVQDAHSRNIALRDIKLKKFIFEDAER